MEHVNFRFAEVGDIPFLWNLYKQLIPEMQNTHEDMVFSLNKIQQNRGGVIVGVYKDEIVSTCQVLIFENLVRAPNRRGIIESIVVDEKYRGMGIGTNMLLYAINYAKKERCVKLGIISSYHRKIAHNVFHKIGFKDFGKGFISDLAKE